LLQRIPDVPTSNVLPFWCNLCIKPQRHIFVRVDFFHFILFNFPFILIWVRHLWNSLIYLPTCLFASPRGGRAFCVCPYKTDSRVILWYVSHLVPFSRKLAAVLWRSHALGTWVPAYGHVTVDNPARLQWRNTRVYKLSQKHFVSG
jgi:hypothetical protein